MTELRLAGGVRIFGPRARRAGLGGSGQEISVHHLPDDQYVPEPGTLALLFVGRGSMVIGLHRFRRPGTFASAHRC